MSLESGASKSDLTANPNSNLEFGNQGITTNLGTNLEAGIREFPQPAADAARVGHPMGFRFFFWGEFAERCSFYGMKAILAKYMAEELGLGQANGATYFSFFVAACYLMPLFGGWVADRFLGKYWTIVGFSIPYILGHIILGFENYYCLVGAMCLLAMGSGVIKPNISTLMGLTYDQERPGQDKLRSDAFAIFYFAINFGAAISQFALPPLRSRYGYAIAFMFPAILMAISFAIFAAGKRYYAKEVIQIHRHTTPAERAEQWRILGRVFGLFGLVVFFWAIFDQAGSTWIYFTDSCMDRHIFGSKFDADQLQFINPILILGLVPLMTMFYKVLAKKGINLRPTDKMLAGFLLTAGCMGVMALAATLSGTPELRPNIVQPKGDATLTLVIEGHHPVTLSGKIKVNATEPGQVFINCETTDKTDVKVALSSDSDLKLVEEKGKVVVHGVVAKWEMKTKKEGQKEKAEEFEHVANIMVTGDLTTTSTWFVPRKDLASIWWLLLAYFVITVAEVLISVTGLELAYTAAPKHMTGFVTAGWLMTVFLANLLINAPVTRLYTEMQPAGYFGGLAAMMLVVTGLFVFVAKKFNQSAGLDERTTSEAITEAV